MTRAIAIGIALLATVGFATAGPHPERPNVLLILLDDNDYEYSAYLGHPAAHTPNLDRIQSEGCTFTNGYTTMATCRPALASLISGRHVDEHCIKNNLTPQQLSPLNALPALLRDAGYATFIGGKFWERTSGVTDPASYGFTYLDRVQGMGNGQFVRDGQEGFLAFISARAEEQRPWFAWYAPSLPHLPTDCPQQYVDAIDADAIPIPSWVDPADRDAFRNDSRLYLANLAWLDAALGAVLLQLETCQSLDNTIIITLSDNGWGYGFISKQSPYEKGLRTPISFTWPGVINPQIRTDLVSIVDVPPTILRFAGLTPPPRYTGIALNASIASGVPVRASISGHNYSIYRYPDDNPGNTSTLVALWSRTPRYKYIRFLRDVDESISNSYLQWRALYRPFPLISAGEEQLFDLSADPYERVNVVHDASLSGVLNALRQTTDAWDARHRKNLPLNLAFP